MTTFNPMTMAGLLTDQTAIVTGGGGGIGRAIALALAGAGANIVIADIVPERCDEVAERIRELGREALPVPTDVMDTGQLRATVAQADQRFGRIDIMVNNAGGGTYRAILEQSERSWRRHIDINLMSVLVGTAAAVPVMIRGGRGGSVINVSSIEGSRAAPNYAIAAACKAAVNNFTRSAALEFSDHRIRVNAIAPDEIVTPGIFATLKPQGERTGSADPTDEHTQAAMKRIPLQRYGLDRDCASAVLFLVSEMSSYVTGTVLPIDGGTWASSGWLRSREGKWVLAEV
jgi:NAD(P)-dependent dehydrogenase (short-subunit alcohol dehydrogenase family)